MPQTGDFPEVMDNAYNDLNSLHERMSHSVTQKLQFYSNLLNEMKTRSAKRVLTAQNRADLHGIGDHRLRYAFDLGIGEGAVVRLQRD